MTTELFMINQVATWTGLCAVGELEPEWGEAALVGGRQLAIFRLWDGRVIVTSNIDPRTGAAVMARGIVGSRGGCPTVTSPLHKESYSLLTGDCFGNPALQLEVVASRVADGQVQVQIQDTAQHPAWLHRN